MGNELQDAAEKFLSGADGQKIAGKRGEIERLAQSKDGMRVKSMLEQGGFDQAVKNGDTAAIKGAISEVLKTDAGARLMASLQSLMGK